MQWCSGAVVQWFCSGAEVQRCGDAEVLEEVVGAEVGATDDGQRQVKKYVKREVQR